MFYWLLVTFVLFPLIYFLLTELVKLYTNNSDMHIGLDAVVEFMKKLPNYRMRIYRKGDDSHGDDNKDAS